MVGTQVKGGVFAGRCDTVVLSVHQVENIATICQRQCARVWDAIALDGVGVEIFPVVGIVRGVKLGIEGCAWKNSSHGMGIENGTQIRL